MYTMVGPKDYKKALDISTIKLEKLKIKFDITTLDMVISFIYKDSVLGHEKHYQTYINYFVIWMIT